MENRSIDVNEGNRAKSEVKEFLLPAVCVNLNNKILLFLQLIVEYLSHLDHDAGESEAENDKYQADEEPEQGNIEDGAAPAPVCLIRIPGKSAKLVAYNSVQDEEGDIGDHAEENTGDKISYCQQ